MDTGTTVDEAIWEAVERVAQAFGLSPETIKAHIKTGKVRGQKNAPVAAVRVIVFHQLRKLGASTTQLGRALGVNHTSVIRCCQALSEADAVALLIAHTKSRPSPIVLRRLPDENLTDNRSWRQAYDEAVEECATVASSNGLKAAGKKWKRACKLLFPLSWEMQAATLPHGISMMSAGEVSNAWK